MDRSPVPRAGADDCVETPPPDLPIAAAVVVAVAEPSPPEAAAAAAAAAALAAAPAAPAAAEAAPPIDEPEPEPDDDDDAEDDAEIELDVEEGADGGDEEGSDDDATEEANATFDEGATKEGYGIISGVSNDKAPTSRELKKAFVAFKETDVGWCVAMVTRQVVASARQHEFALAFEAREHSTRALHPSLFVKNQERR